MEQHSNRLERERERYIYVQRVARETADERQNTNKNKAAMKESKSWSHTLIHMYSYSSYIRSWLSYYIRALQAHSHDA